jgi:drug/metabolite transporter (DMT)-like permease
VLGVGTAFAMSLFLVGVHQAGAARAATLSTASPLFGVPLAVLVLKEQITWRLLAGATTTLLGVWFIVAR